MTGLPNVPAADEISEPEEAPEDRTPFGQCSDMEDALGQIQNMISALSIIANDQSDKRMSEALYGISNALQAAYDDLGDQWERLYKALAEQKKTTGAAP